MYIPIEHVYVSLPFCVGVNSIVAVPSTGIIFETLYAGIVNAREQPKALFAIKVRETGIPALRVLVSEVYP